MAAPGVFFAVMVLLGFLTPGYNAITTAGSNLSLGLRRSFRDQLEALGYRPENQTSFEVRQADKKALLYDLVVAGRHPLAKPTASALP